MTMNDAPPHPLRPEGGEGRGEVGGVGGGERSLVLVLAAIQFTHIMDFMIMMPLGPQLMRVMLISPQQFGLLVSAYTLTAAVAALAVAFYTDRFDRRQALLFLYAGFVISTLLCGIAPGYGELLAARAVAGAFGGVAGATVHSIIGDAVPENRRGAATGMIMSAFALSSIISRGAPPSCCSLPPRRSCSFSLGESSRRCEATSSRVKCIVRWNR